MTNRMTLVTLGLVLLVFVLIALLQATGYLAPLLAWLSTHALPRP